MIKNGESFIIQGSKDLIFRKENDYTMVFDPYDLLSYRLNEVAAEMMFLVYKKYNVTEFVKYFHDKYGAEEDEILNNLKMLVQNTPCIRAIIPNMIFLGLIKWN